MSQAMAVTLCSSRSRSPDVPDPPNWSAGSHMSRAMWLVQIGALCIVARGETTDRAMDRYRAVAGRGRRSDAGRGLSVGLTACGQRGRSTHVPDVGRCTAMLDGPRQPWLTAAGGDSRSALALWMASATGWSTTVARAVTAPAAAGAAASRSLPGRPDDWSWMSCVPWWRPSVVERCDVLRRLPV